MKSLHELVAAAESDRYIIRLEGVVGVDITSSQFAKDLALARGRPVLLEIDSGGGALPTALAIVGLIRGYAGTTSARITRACSAAALIALAADARSIHRGGCMLFHRTRIIVSAGHSTELEQALQTARAGDDESYRLIRERTGLDREQWARLDGLPLDGWRCLDLRPGPRLRAGCRWAVADPPTLGARADERNAALRGARWPARA